MKLIIVWSKSRINVKGFLGMLFKIIGEMIWMLFGMLLLNVENKIEPFLLIFKMKDKKIEFISVSE
jgi:hypothetical protein